jgi:cell division protein FtsQ
LGLALAIFVAAPLWWWQSGRAAQFAGELYARALAASAEQGLAVRKVLCEGRDETSRAAVLEALELKRGQPILAFDPKAAKERLEALVWVRAAAVERRLPDTIAVHLAERRPIALWQRNGRLLLVDEEGVVLLRDGLERFAGLPLIAGNDAPRHAPALLAMLSVEPTLESRVNAAVRVGGRRWNLRLDNGIDVLLPEEGAELAWRRLADLERRHGLLERDLTAVDLRLPDQLVVRLSPGAAQRARDPGRST